MTIGMNKDEIIKELNGTELKQETVQAIAEIITKNNRKIEKQLIDKFYDDFNKKFELGGIR